MRWDEPGDAPAAQFEQVSFELLSGGYVDGSRYDLRGHLVVAGVPPGVCLGDDYAIEGIVASRADDVQVPIPALGHLRDDSDPGRLVLEVIGEIDVDAVEAELGDGAGEVEIWLALRWGPEHAHVLVSGRTER